VVITEHKDSDGVPSLRNTSVSKDRAEGGTMSTGRTIESRLLHYQSLFLHICDRGLNQVKDVTTEADTYY
jgi:hypothetical protein